MSTFRRFYRNRLKRKMFNRIVRLYSLIAAMLFAGKASIKIEVKYKLRRFNKKTRLR